ncbi:hypothetical protein DVK02_12750 [Halobellus sp. Atlit-31R]|nr:hypothetical protein DVK02_12750 [Halobellus sp. Atlit-31R]
MTTLADYDGGVDRDDWREYVVEDSLTGYLIDVAGRNEVNDAKRLKLLRCPVCGRSWTWQWDAEGENPLATHLERVHGPADFGLCERGER